MMLSAVLSAHSWLLLGLLRHFAVVWCNSRCGHCSDDQTHPAFSLLIATQVVKDNNLEDEFGISLNVVDKDEYNDVDDVANLRWDQA